MSQHKQEQEQAQEEPPQVNFNLFPYYYDVIKWHELLKSDNPKDQLEGALEIGLVAWNGGELSQNFIGKSSVLKTLANLYDGCGDSNPLLKMRIIQSIGIVCRGNLDIQQQLVELNFVARIFSSMGDLNQETRKWATNTMFVLLCDCPNAQNSILKIPNLREQLEKNVNDDWSTWDFNDAKEIQKILRMRELEVECIFS